MNSGLSTSNLPSVGKGKVLVSPVIAAYTDTNRIEHNFLPRTYTKARWSAVTYHTDYLSHGQCQTRWVRAELLWLDLWKECTYIQQDLPRRFRFDHVHDTTLLALNKSTAGAINSVQLGGSSRWLHIQRIFTSLGV